MYEIVFHGRGGQGALLAARVLANAYFFSGQAIEAFPHFGGERRGAPVRAFLRVDDKPIRIKSPILSADCVIILDASLLEFVDIASGLKETGLIVLNTALSPDQVKLTRQYKTATCNATDIALRLMGKDIPNSAILGAFAFAVGLNMDHLKKGFEEIFLHQKAIDKNFEIAKVAAAETAVGICGVEERREDKGMAKVLNTELKVGGTYKSDGSSLHNITSTWSPFKAQLDDDKCNQCLLCYAACPEGCILRTGNGLNVDEKYCKGCGICEEVCPSEAIHMVRKQK